MFFGVVLSPMGWLLVAALALFIMVAPLVVIGSLSENFAEPYRTGLMVLGAYVVWPMIVAWLYKTKLRNTGRGSLIFYFYVGLYSLFFVVILSKLFSGNSSWDDYLGVLVLGSVSSGLIWFAFKTRRKVLDDVAKSEAEIYEAVRSEDIQRQTEAILLAEEIKSKKKQT